MKIVSSIFPPEFIQAEMRAEFPEYHIDFFRGMEEAEESFYQAEVFITYGEDLTPEHIKKAASLKWIMVMSAGMERMPFDACIEKGIMVTNARGIHKIPMAEYTIGTMLHHVKNTQTLRENEKNELWERRVHVEELSDKTALILGVGAIGGEIARLAKAFRMTTLGVNTSGEQVEFVDHVYKMGELSGLLPQADFVISVLPSTNETKYIMTREYFEKMKTSAVLINIGRGDLYHEEDLVHALETNQFLHAYLDVFHEEPLENGHPFWKMSNVTVTPHLSSKTKKYLPRCFEIFKHNLHTYIKKQNDFINPIDLKRGY